MISEINDFLSEMTSQICATMRLVFARRWNPRTPSRSVIVCHASEYCTWQLKKRKNTCMSCLLDAVVLQRSTVCVCVCVRTSCTGNRSAWGWKSESIMLETWVHDVGSECFMQGTWVHDVGEFECLRNLSAWRWGTSVPSKLECMTWGNLVP